MAQMEGLYFGMGIDTSQLHSDFVDAEKTINQNLARINKEMQLIRIKGQVELEGLDESASTAEKLRIQEEALTEQINLQQDKIILLAGTYKHLIETRGENAEATKQLEFQLTREQLAMQRLENQIADLSKQEEIAIGFNLELLGLIEPAWKAIDMAVASGRTLPIPVPHAKAAAAAATGLLALAEGSKEATEELREDNPAKLLDESFRQASINIDDSWQRISESTQRGTAEMQNHIKRTTEFSTAEMQKHAEQVKSQEFKIFPEINEGDFTRFLRVIEDYRTSESAVNALELIKQSESVIGTLLATLTGIGYAATKVDISSIELAQTSIDNFKELAQAANELNIPLERASDFMSKIFLTGADYNDVRDYVRGVQDAVIKGDSEDPEVIALEKYGVVIQDTKGKLLAFDETLDRLYQGYLKAREAGEAEAYVIMTNGQAVQDVLPYFEKLAQAEEDMAKIKWATIDFAILSEASHNMKLVEAQINEFKNALSSLAVPAANIALQNTFDKFKSLTEIVEENRDEVIYWSFVLMEGVDSLQNFAKGLSGEAKEKLIEFREVLKDFDEKFDITGKLKSLFADEPKKPIEEEAKEYFIPFYNELKQLEEEFGAISKLEGFLPKGFTQEIDSAINGYLVPLYQTIKNIKEELSITNKIKNAVSDFIPEDLFSGAEETFDSIFARAKKDMEEFKKANEEARKEIEKARDESAGLSYSWNRIAKYKSELEKIKFDIQFGDGYSYQKVAAQNKLWYEEAMKDAKQYEREKAILDELYAAKSEKLEKERAKKVSDIRKSVDEEFKSDIDARIDKINEEKDAWISAGMDAAEAMELSQRRIGKAMQDAAKEFEREVDRIKGSVQSLEDEIFEMEHSQYQNDFRKLQQEYMKKAQEYQESGMLPFMQGRLDRWYDLRKSKLNERAAKDKDYRKSPDGGAMQRGGNGIQVISGDKIIDDGLIQAQQKEIGLLADENQIRAQLLQKERQELSSDAWAMLAQQVQQTPQPQIAPPQQQQSSGFQIIEGDKIVSMPTEPLQEFGYNLQQLNSAMAQMPFDTPADMQSPLATALPTESFQALQMSTTELATAQDILAEKFRSLSEMQMANPAISQGGFMLETPLNNLDVPLSSILQEMQTKQTTTLSVETIVLPLNNIASITSNILSALSDRKPANINVAPSIRVELSGAYVFDNAMKKSLTDDITKEIVSEITSAVRSATSQSSYGYGA